MDRVTHPKQPPQRRESDRGTFRRVLAWWHDWGQLVVGIIAVSAAVGLLIVGLEVKGIEQQNARQRTATALAARQSCIRSRQFGPRLIDFYEYAQYTLPRGQRRHVLTHRQAAQYRASIPKTCPAR